ncbi:MAG: zinc metallopeptidase [Culicoidibacterales bacterium]
MEIIFGYYYMGFDPLYLFLTLGIMIVSMIIQAKLSSTFQRYSNVKNLKNLTGAQVARMILDQNGLSDVPVERISGQLTDHYDPSTRVVRLSESNYDQTGVASIAVAAHECGHAIQHKESYAMLILRGKMFPVVSLSSQLAPFLLMIGLGLAYTSTALTSLSTTIFLAGIILFAIAVFFHIVTLPVEFDASNRALKILQSSQILDPSEVAGGKRVLNAAAMTYVVAALAAISQLIFFIIRFLDSQR